MNIKQNAEKIAGWDEVIAYAESRIASNEKRTIQIMALIETFRRKQAAGEPSPFEVASGKIVSEVRAIGF